MKRYLTGTFLALSLIILVIGFQFDFRWNGIVAWGLALICCILAAYFTKYIPNKKINKKQSSE